MQPSSGHQDDEFYSIIVNKNGAFEEGLLFTPRFSCQDRGSALMIMIWALLLMSMVVMGLTQYLNFSAQESVIDASEFRALHLAESGLTVGLHPDTRRGDIVLKQKSELTAALMWSSITRVQEFPSI